MADELKTEEQPSQIEEKNIEETKTVTMEQAKLDELINSRYRKGAEKASSEFLTELGVDDIDVLKSIVTSHREMEEASKTELQKLQEQLDAERAISEGLESKLAETQTETEIQNIAISHGINPEKIKYFKMDYLDAKNSEGFVLDDFIGDLKAKQPDFFGFVDERRQNVPNPPNKRTPSTAIKMTDYVQLPAAERRRYKSSDIIR